MTTPSVTEMAPALEPVEPDPFIETLPRSPDLDAARQDRARRLESVRRLMRMRATRNGPARRTTDRV